MSQKKVNTLGVRTHEPCVRCKTILIIFKTLPARRYDFWYSVGDMPVMCLKYLPNDDWVLKLSA